MDSLTKLVDTNSTAHKMFLVWALRYRNRRTTDIYLFRNYLKRNGTISDAEYKQTFAALQEMGIGSIDGGKFKWNVPLKQTALKVMRETKGMVESRNRLPVIVPPVNKTEEYHEFRTKDYIIKITVQPQGGTGLGLTKEIKPKIKAPKIKIKKFGFPDKSA